MPSADASTGSATHWTGWQMPCRYGGSWKLGALYARASVAQTVPAGARCGCAPDQVSGTTISSGISRAAAGLALGAGGRSRSTWAMRAWMMHSNGVFGVTPRRMLIWRRNPTPAQVGRRTPDGSPRAVMTFWCWASSATVATNWKLRRIERVSEFDGEDREGYHVNFRGLRE